MFDKNNAIIAVRRDNIIDSSLLKAMDSMNNDDNSNVLQQLLSEMMSCRCVLDHSSISFLQICTSESILKLSEWLLPYLRSTVGDDREYDPMYPNFPQQVIESTDGELFINALLHYITGGDYLPVYEKLKRQDLKTIFFVNEYKILQLDVVDYNQLYNKIISQNSQPNSIDKADIKQLSFHHDTAPELSNIVNKEMLAIVLAEWYSCVKQLIPNAFKTATDVLRFVTALSGGDVSLVEKCRYISFNRTLRKYILCELDKTSNLIEDMYRHQSKWKRVGERLHPGEFKSRYINAFNAFHSIRNEKNFTSFYSTVNKLKAEGSWIELLRLFSTRPGELIRNINALLNSIPDVYYNELFRILADLKNVDVRVLWQAYSFFSNKEKYIKYQHRYFVPKGTKASFFAYENNLQQKDYNDSVVSSLLLSLIVEHYKSNEFVGKKVWIDPICKKLLLPTLTKHVSDNTLMVGRGSRFAIQHDIVRLFMWWTNIECDLSWFDRVDLDLGASFLNDEFVVTKYVNWTNLRDSDISYHSGDITDAPLPDGASEFVDINLPKFRDSNDVKYVAVIINNYTGQLFSQLPNAIAGWMERDEINSGEIYEPSTVAGKFKLTTNSTAMIPFIVDVDNNEIIWCDISFKYDRVGSHIGGCVSDISAVAKGILQFSETRTKLMDVFTTKILSQGGEIVESRDDANFVISPNGDVSPYNITEIMSNWV